jgi:hypothetical protein
MGVIRYLKPRRRKGKLDPQMAGMNEWDTDYLRSRVVVLNLRGVNLSSPFAGPDSEDRQGPF